MEWSRERPNRRRLINVNYCPHTCWKSNHRAFVVFVVLSSCELGEMHSERFGQGRRADVSAASLGEERGAESSGVQIFAWLNVSSRVLCT